MSKYKSLFELFSGPRWCQHTSARDHEGRRISKDSSAACYWCLSAGVDVVYPAGAPKHNEVVEKLNVHARGLGYSDIVSWNDAAGRMREEVVQLCAELNI